MNGYNMPNGFRRLEEYTYIFGSRFVFNVPIIAEPEPKIVGRHIPRGDGTTFVYADTEEAEPVAISQTDARIMMDAWEIANCFSNLRRTFETRRLGISGTMYDMLYGWGYRDLEKIFRYVRHVLSVMCQHNRICLNVKKPAFIIEFDGRPYTEQDSIHRYVFQTCAKETENVEERAYLMDYLHAYGLASEGEMEL